VVDSVNLPCTNLWLVDKNDYDILVASVEHHKAMAAKWQHEAEMDLARIKVLESSIRKWVGDCTCGCDACIDLHDMLDAGGGT